MAYMLIQAGACAVILALSDEQLSLQNVLSNLRLFRCIYVQNVLYVAEVLKHLFTECVDCKSLGRVGINNYKV